MAVTQQQLETTLTTALAGLSREFTAALSVFQTEMSERVTEMSERIQDFRKTQLEEMAALRKEIKDGDDRVIEHLGRAITAGFIEQEERVKFLIREAETNALRGVFLRDRGYTRRFHSVEALQTDDRARLEILESRVLELEDRLGIPPTNPQ